jgi:iron complex outermembrane receptor protein
MPPGTPIAGFDLQRSKSWGAAQWRGAADYKLSKDAFGFASVSRGFRSGGFNGGARSVAEASAEPFNPEYVTTYEAGVKTEWLARSVRLNATVFQNDYKDQQVAFLSTGVQFGTSTQDAKIYGLELESVWVPAQGARLFANLGLLHGSTNSEVNKFVPNANYQYSVGADYNGRATSKLNWFIGANYFHTAGYDLSAALDPLRRVAAHGDLGARIGLASEDGTWKLELSGTNLLNDYWPVFSFNIPNLFTVRTPNQPRTFALRLSFNH